MKRLRELRKSKNLTQLALGMELGISQESISGYESGRQIPELPNVQRMADYFNVSIDYLCGRSNIRYLREDDYTEDEINFLGIYRSLTKERRAKAAGYLQALADE